MKRVQLALFLAAAVSAGCRDQVLQPPAGGPSALIMDGAHSGNAFFYFLPPLVPNPSSFFHAGKFNAGLSPVVEVCELTADPRLVPAADCKDATRVFGPARMTLDGANEQYQLNWDTKASPLSAIKFYRIFVLGAARGTPLGFVDVDPVDQGMKNVRTGDVVAFQDGRTLPVKVRIEDGAFGSHADDHVEQVVSNNIPTGTLDITTNTGTAGARFSNGWLPPGVDQVVVIIERLNVNNGNDETSCLRSGLEELEGCYRFRTDPDLHGLGPDGTDLHFQVPVIAGVCFEIPGSVGDEDGPPFELRRREEARGVPVGPTFVLEEVPAPFLRCDAFEGSGISLRDALHSGNLADVASAGWRALVRGAGRLVTPQALYAVDFGAGGSTDEFSRFGFARTAHLNITLSVPSAAAGTDVTLSARVTSSHHESISSVVGAPVAFTVTGGGGSVNVGTVNTNADGVASVRWRMGTVPTTNSVVVSTPHVLETPITVATPSFAGLIDFQSLPNGGSPCENCLVTNEFASEGIVFSGNPVQWFASSTYDPTTEPNNNSVTPTTGGTTRLTFPGAPTAITFRARLNNGLPAIGIRAFTPSGTPISVEQINVETLATYLNGGGNQFRTEAVSITNSGGVGYFEFDNTDPTAFFYIMDNFQLGYGSSLPQYACSLEPSLHSINSDVAASINFANHTGGPVSVYWIDYTGQRVLYTTLAAEQSYTQETFLTHPWVVTNASGACLGIWLPSAAPGTAAIGG